MTAGGRKTTLNNVTQTHSIFVKLLKKYLFRHAKGKLKSWWSMRPGYSCSRIRGVIIVTDTRAYKGWKCLYISGLVMFIRCSRGGCWLATDYGNQTPDLVIVAKVVYLRCSRLCICLHWTHHVPHMSKSHHIHTNFSFKSESKASQHLKSST